MLSRGDLTTYARPNVAVDLALLTVLPSQEGAGLAAVSVLIQDRTAAPSGRCLPGRFLRERQTVREGVADLLRLDLDLAASSVTPKLVRIFDDPERDERAWTISLAHAVARPSDTVVRARGEFVPIDRDGSLVSGEALLFDHDTIVRESAAALRDRYELRPDPDRLLGDTFTLAELRSLHEAVLGEPLLRDTFNRRMTEYLRPTSETRTAGGRPATVYERVGDHSSIETVRRRLQLPRRRPERPGR